MIKNFNSKQIPDPCIIIDNKNVEDIEPQRNENIEQLLSTNPSFLSPFQNTINLRKNSLPTPTCTTELTASKVRRLSERGEGDVRKIREAAFLSTLQSVATNITDNIAQTYGRRHSVVTITKIPKHTSRRESIGNAAIRRSNIGNQESGCSIINEHLGSSRHSLQLDIMDDIINTRKLINLKSWTSGSTDKIEPVNEIETPLETKSGIYSSLTSSSLEINKRHKSRPITKAIDFVKKKRSGSLDPTSKANWFVRRHLPMKMKTPTCNLLKSESKKNYNSNPLKIDVQAIGNAFENLLSTAGPSTSKNNTERKSSFVNTSSKSNTNRNKSWSSWFPSMHKEKNSSRSILKNIFQK